MLTPSQTAPVLRVALIRTSSLGDVVLATSCLAMLSSLPFPVEIIWLGRGITLDMIQRSWPQVRTIELPKNGNLTTLQNIIDQLKSIHFVVDLQCNLRSKWLCRNLKLQRGIPFFEAEKAQLLRSKLILEGRLRGRRRPLDPKALKPPFFQYRLMYEALFRGLKHHLPHEYLDDVKNRDFAPELPISENFDPPWRKELRFGNWLAIAPGAAYPTKQAPLALMSKIIKKTFDILEKKSGPGATKMTSEMSSPHTLGLVFLGDTKDREFSRTMIDSLGWNGPLLNLAGKLSLWESAVALHDARVLLSNDSSLAHIAEAVGTPVTMLFGPTIESFGFAPRMPESGAFSSLVGCRPCSKHGIVTCRYGDQLCFHAIDTEKVATHMSKYLMDHPSPLTFARVPASLSPLL